MKYPEFKWSEDEVVTQDRYLQFAKANSNTCVFIKTDYIYNSYNEIPDGADNSALATIWDPMNVKPLFPPLQRRWITGNSDYPITKFNSQKYANEFDRWYGINMEETSEEFQAIPLGPVENTVQILRKISNEPRELSDALVYMNFNVNTYTSERAAVHLVFQDMPWVTSDMNSRLEINTFYRNIRNHKFTFCPRGNGVDTYRFWETLYLGSIPVVREHPEMEPFFSKLPVVKVKNWSNLTKEYLESEYERIMECDTWDFDILRMSYWEKCFLAN